MLVSNRTYFSIVLRYEIHFAKCFNSSTKWTSFFIAHKEMVAFSMAHPNSDGAKKKFLRGARGVKVPKVSATQESLQKMPIVLPPKKRK